MRVIKTYRGKNSRKRAIGFTKYGKVDVDITNYNLGHKVTIKSAVNKTNYFQHMLNDIFKDVDIKVITSYKDNKTTIVVEVEGICHRVLPKNLIKGVVPSIRSATIKSKYLEKEFKKIHGDKYSYPHFSYKGVKHSINITCSKHGDFKQEIKAHLNGCGCPQCGWHNAAGNRLTHTKGVENAIVYCLKMVEDDGRAFYKIGFTKHSVSYRYHSKWMNKISKSRMPYDYNIIFEKVGKIEECIMLEKHLHSKYSKEHYTPLKPFDGSATECYLKLDDYEEIIQT